MTTNSAVNLEITNAADGVEISGGTVKRKLKWLGSDVTITGTGTATHVFPSTSSVLARTDEGQIFTGTQTFTTANASPMSINATAGDSSFNLLNASYTKTLTATYSALTRVLNFVAYLRGDQGGGTGVQVFEGLVADVQYLCTADYMSSIVALRAIPRNYSTGTATLGTLRGLQVSPVLNSGQGLVSNYYGIELTVVGTGNVTTSVGLKILNQCGSGGVTNGYGIYIDNQAGASTLNYSIYSAGTSKMYHGGDVEIGGNLTLSASNIITDTTTGLKIGTATTQKIAFFNSTPIVKPTVTGSKGGNAALTSLCTQLAALGLIVNSTT